MAIFSWALRRLLFFCVAGIGLSSFGANLTFEITSSGTGFSGPVTNEVTAGNFATVQLRSDYPQGHIFYTLDGSEPSAASQPYSQSFTLQSNAVIRAIAFNSALTESVRGQLTVSVIPAYNLRIISNPADLVTVTPDHRIEGNPSGDHGFYLSNSVVTLTATERSGLRFQRWEGDVTGTNQEVMVVMDNQKHLTARYVSSPVVTIPAGGGRVEVSPPEVAVGEYARVTAIPDAGYFFAAWGGDVSGNQNPAFVFMHMPQVPVSALFAPLASNQVSFTAVLDGPGTLRKTETNVVTRGGTVSLEIDLKPRDPSAPRALRFEGWTGTYEGFENPLGLTLEESAFIRGRTSTPDVQLLPFNSPTGTNGVPAIAPDGTVYLSAGDLDVRAYTPDLQLKWFTNTGLPGVSIPSVGDDGTVFVGGRNGAVVALSPDGEIVSRFSSGEQAQANVAGVPHPLAVASDNTVYSSSLQSQNVYASRNGQLVRTIPPYRRDGFDLPSLPMLGPDNTVYLPTSDGFRAESPAGEPKWSAPYPRPIAIDAAGRLYSVATNQIVALDFNGSNLWTVAIPASRELVIGENGTVFAGTEAGIVALSTNGTILWTNSSFGDIVSAKADGGLLVVSNTRPTSYTFSTLKNIAADGRDSWMEQWWQDAYRTLPSNAALSPTGEIYQILPLLSFNTDAVFYHTRGDVGPAHSSWPSRWGTRNTGRAVIPSEPVHLMITQEPSGLRLQASGLSEPAALESSSDLQTWTETGEIDPGKTLPITAQGRRFYRLRID